MFEQAPRIDANDKMRINFFNLFMVAPLFTYYLWIINDISRFCQTFPHKNYIRKQEKDNKHIGVFRARQSIYHSYPADEALLQKINYP